MSDIRKYINIIEQSTKSPEKHTQSSDYDETTSKFVSLIENAQFMVESFKDARRKFVDQSGDDELVKSYLETFKDLAKRNIIKGDEKDISQWIKGGWDNFQTFVDSKSGVKSKREQDKEKKSDSIVVHEDSEKMVVIPLSEESSCYYGRNTQWCTAATSSRNHFNEYFGGNEITLFYILLNDGSKLAVAYNGDSGSYEAFDQQDDSVDMDYITEMSGVTEENLETWYNQHKEVIAEHQDTTLQFKKLIERYINGDVSDEQMNEGIENFQSIVEPAYEFDILVKDGKAMIDVDPIFETVESYTNYLTGHDHLEPSNEHNIRGGYIISKVDRNLQMKIFTRIAEVYGDEMRDIMGLDVDESFDLRDVEDNIDEFASHGYDDDLSMALIRAKSDAEIFGTEANIIREVANHVEGLFDELSIELPSHWIEMYHNHATNFVSFPVKDIPAVIENSEDIDLERPELDIETEIDYDSLGDAFHEAIHDSNFFD